MNTTSKTIAAIVDLSLMGAGSAMAAEMEQCYGVAKAGKNDCKTAASSCAGTASTR